MPSEPALPAYTVRESARVRHVRLRYSLQDGLEVTIPRGYDRTRLPDVIAEKRAWIHRTHARLEAQQRSLPAEYGEKRPSRLQLRALDEAYEIEYTQSRANRLSLQLSGDQLRLTGPIDDYNPCVDLLNRWLRIKGEETLVPWLRRVSQELGLPYQQTTVRGQRSRWGSCSSSHNINLNYKLLFLPPEYVYYLFTHELCHTRHLNHSAGFWTLVQQKLPGYRRIEKEMKQAWRYVPRWVGS